MQIISSGRGNGKLTVIALHEPRQESVAVVHAADALQAQILDQTVLQRPVHSFDSALGLARVCAKNLDV
ncbi:hypothetical protein D9M72_533410 [compost metagenome]